MDYKKVSDRYSDSISQYYPFDAIFSNPDHWSLNFVEIKELAIKMAQVIYELEVFDFKNSNLPRSIVAKIDSFRNNLNNYFGFVREFKIDQWNALDTKRNYISSFRSLYDNEYSTLESVLNNIKLEKLFQDKSALKVLVDDSSDITQYKKEVEGLKTQFSNLVKDLRSIQPQSIEAWALENSIFFATQADTHQIEKNKWLLKRNRWFYWFIIWLISIIIIYTASQLDIGFQIIHKVVILGFSLVSFLLLYFGFSFSTNNYYLEKWLEIENSHRKNIANTAPKIQAWLSSDEHKAIIITEQVKALFSPIGWKMEQKWTEITTPFLEIIKSLVGKIG